MTEAQWESLQSDLAAHRAMLIALAFAAPNLANVVAELERAKEMTLSAMNPQPISESQIELTKRKIEKFEKFLKGEV